MRAISTPIGEARELQNPEVDKSPHHPLRGQWQAAQNIGRQRERVQCTKSNQAFQAKPVSNDDAAPQRVDVAAREASGETPKQEDVSPDPLLQSAPWQRQDQDWRYTVTSGQ
jgi:hypothetical protein